MFDKKELETISYFKDVVEIKEIKQGYEERKKYKIITKNKIYFLKIHHCQLNQEEITRGKKLYEIYQSLNIPVIPLLELMPYKDRSVFIYPFFEGISLKEANMKEEEYYQYGVKIGKEVVKLRKASIDFKLFDKVNLSNYYQEEQKHIQRLWKNKEYQQKIGQIFSTEELRYLLMKYKSLLEFVKTQEFLLNHNDIKVSNVMLDQQKNYYLVDIDPIGLTPQGFNIYYSIYSFLLPNFKEKEKSFLRGFIQTIAPNRQIVKQIQYFLISDMINEAEKLLDSNFFELQSNKEYLKKIIFNQEEFLEKKIYEEK